MAYRGAWLGPGRVGAIREAVPLAVPMDTVRFVGPGVTAGSMDDGLKLQLVPLGKPLQENVIFPRVGSGAATLITILAVLPWTTVTLELCGVMTMGGPSVTLSVAVLLLGFTSPPPETVAVLVNEFWMLMGTFTVSVIAG